MAAKESRIVVRMSLELRSWLDAEADKIGLDAAAFVRMQLTQSRNGPLQQAPLRGAAYFPADHGASDDEPHAAPEIDISAMVQQTMESAKPSLDADALALDPIDRVSPIGGRRLPRTSQGQNILVRR